MADSDMIFGESLFGVCAVPEWFIEEFGHVAGVFTEHVCGLAKLFAVA